MDIETRMKVERWLIAIFFPLIFCLVAVKMIVNRYDDKQAKVEQLSYSYIVPIEDVTLDECQVSPFPTPGSNVCYVSFDYNWKHYSHVRVVGSQYSTFAAGKKTKGKTAEMGGISNEFWDMFNPNDLPRGCHTRFFQPSVVQKRTGRIKYSSYDFAHRPQVSEVIAYNHDQRLKKGEYGIQLNKFYPSLSWQLKHKYICLVGNV